MVDNVKREGGWLSDSEWANAVTHLPIACVDLVPISRNVVGAISRIGLIRRKDSPTGEPVWCHLGGRVLVNELLIDAAHRHLTATLDHTGPTIIQREPFFVNQYLRQASDGVGVDHRKHPKGDGGN